ncbi:NAD(P)-binding oxidoreductase [Jiangella rhizosphaerae]|nr:NAD(P)-binding oxidoreductase [Jiangella rhizosphaerae]
MPHLAVLGATSATGRHLLGRLTAIGSVAALTRQAPPETADSTVRWLQGDATDVGSVFSAIKDADVVITMVAASRMAEPGTVRSDATRALLAALAQSGADSHLVAVSALGGHGSADQLSRAARWIYRRVVGADRLAEVDRQEELIRSSGIPATIVRPPRLDDRPASGYQEVTGKASSSLRLHREDLADCLADLATNPPPTALRFLTIASV